jgi:hypothetical protein
VGSALGYVLGGLVKDSGIGAWGASAIGVRIESWRWAWNSTRHSSSLGACQEKDEADLAGLEMPFNADFLLDERPTKLYEPSHIGHVIFVIARVYPDLPRLFIHGNELAATHELDVGKRRLGVSGRSRMDHRLDRHNSKEQSDKSENHLGVKVNSHKVSWQVILARISICHPGRHRL